MPFLRVIPPNTNWAPVKFSQLLCGQC